MSILYSILFYPVLFVSTILFGSAAILVVFLTGNKDLAHLCGRIWGNVNLRTAGVTVKVRGLENIDPKHSYVFASNHESWFDIFAILGKLPVQFRWLAKEELFKLFVLGRAMAAIGYIPIDRSDRRKAFESIQMAADRVKSGTSMVIFPEGTRSSDGVLQGFKKGGFILAIQSQQPIIPISLSGSHRILPKRGRWIIEPGVIRMTIEKPIPTAGLTIKDRDYIISTVRSAMMRNLPQSEGGTIPDNTEDSLW